MVCAVALSVPFQATAQASDTVRATIHKQATLSDGSALLRVKTRCPAGARVLEAFAYITQDDQTSQFSGLPLACDGKPHTVVLTVRPFDGAPFHSGGARATTYALVQLPGSTDTVQGGDTRTIALRGPG